MTIGRYGRFNVRNKVSLDGTFDLKLSQEVLRSSALLFNFFEETSLSFGRFQCDFLISDASFRASPCMYIFIGI